jgi:predicted metalloprotease with PDZ domain
MRIPARRPIAAWWFVVALAASAAADAAPATFAFTVSTPNPASHQYHVRLRCDGLPGDTTEFRMPVWTPGYYGVFDYAGNVRAFTATDGAGRPLASSKGGPNAWAVQKGPAKTVVLSYDVVATSSFVANAFLDDTRGYITPGALFVYVPGQLRRPVTVTIELHPKWSTVVTGLEPVPNRPPHTYRAGDFDVLYDSPILMGNLEGLPTFRIKGIPHRFVGYTLGDFDRKQFVDDLRAVVEAGTQIIGDIPYKQYTFMGIGPGRGGIEHANSTAVPFSGIGPDRANRIRTLSFLAHEYFHSYNVKRIRPIALGPFDYDRPNVTDMLWVSEGFTSYYEYLMLVRSGRMTPQELLDALSRTITAVESSPGRLVQSAAASSRETWNQGPFGRGGTSAGKTISYYDKGAVLALLLDFRIRHETKNRKSLDTAMRALYRTYYKQLGRGWTEAEFRQTCEETAGTGLADFFEYATTTREIDYGRYLGYGGLRLEPVPAQPAAEGGRTSAPSWRLAPMAAPDARQAAIFATWTAVTVK